MLQITEFSGQLEEDGEIYTDESGVVRCKHDRSIMGTCISCTEEERQGLPPCSGLYKVEDGWFHLWKNPDPRVEETRREGPYSDKEDCRWDSWEAFEDRMMRGELDEQGRKVEAPKPSNHA